VHGHAQIQARAVLEGHYAWLKRRRTPAPHPRPTVAVVPPAHPPRSPSWGSVRTTATLPCTHPHARRVAMSSTDTAAQSPRSIVRAMRRIPVEVVEIVRHMRGIFDAERDSGRTELLMQPVERTARAAGLSARTVVRIAEEGYAATRLRSGKRVRRATKRRIPAAELARVREAVYKQYEEKSVPTLDSTLEYLKVASVVAGWSGNYSTYTWSRATLQRAMTDLGFKFTVGPNHCDVAREKTTIIAQRENFVKKMREYRAAGRTIYYTDETWANKNMTPSRTWTDRSLRARLNVPSSKGARIIVAHVGSRDSELVQDSSLVFLGKKKTGDIHGEVNSDLWLKWLGDKVLDKIQRGVLVVDRAPYHMKLTAESRPASSKMRKAEVVAWLEQHEAVPEDWSATWRQQKTVLELREQAVKHRPTPRYLVQDLAARFYVSVIFSPVAHPELNPIEMVWATVKVALRKANVTFTTSRLQELVNIEFAKISAEAWGRYEDHAIGMENHYMEVAAMRAEVEGSLDAQEIEMDDAEGEGVNGFYEEEEEDEE